MEDTTAALSKRDSGVGQPPLWKTVQSLVLDGLTSPHTRRAYEQALEEFLIWLCADASRPFTKATVQKYRSELQAKGLAPSSINVRISGHIESVISSDDKMMANHYLGIDRNCKPVEEVCVFGTR